MKDRIEQTYEAIDDMISVDGQSKPQVFGGGSWDANEEFEIYKKQVGNRYTSLQWKMFETYFKNKLKEKDI